MKITTIALRRSGDEDSFLVFKEHTPLEGGYPTGVALYSEIFDFFKDDFSEREMKHGTAFTSTKEMIQYLEGATEDCMDIGYVRVANLTITETAHWLKKCGEEFKAPEHPWNAGYKAGLEDINNNTKSWNAGYSAGLMAKHEPAQ